MTRQTITSIWMFSREYGRLAGAGGVKDVVSQLSMALARWTGRTVRAVLPRYGFIDPGELGFSRLPDPLYPDQPLTFTVALNFADRERREQVTVWHRVLDRVHVYLLESERFLEKNDVYTYTREEQRLEPWKVQGSGHYDFFAMNLLLQKAGLELIMLLEERPQIIHCHDGHTAVIPAIMRECSGYRSYFRDTAAVVTIHNAGLGYHQELGDLAHASAVTELPGRVIDASLLDTAFDPFLAAAPYAAMTTVSENYAFELQETDADRLTGWLGHRLLDRGVRIAGITNGVDPAEFDPTDPRRMGLAAGFDPGDPDAGLGGKLVCKKELLRRLATEPAAGEDRVGTLAPDPSRPLYTFIGRLSEQKGVDIFAAAVETFLANRPEAAVVCLGSGGEAAESAVVELAGDDRCRGRVCFLRGYDPALAIKVYAAGDFFVVPSRYEPCGLTDLIAQLFGNLPIVHRVGGLVKVVHEETGFSYRPNTPERLAGLLEHTADVFADRKRIRAMQAAAVQRIRKHHTWNRVMKSYVELYKKSRRENLPPRP